MYLILLLLRYYCIPSYYDEAKIEIIGIYQYKCLALNLSPP